MFGKGSVVFSIQEIKRTFPNQWVAIAVTEIDADGFAASGEVIVHDHDERFVWSAARLGDAQEPIYVFYTGTITRSLRQPEIKKTPRAALTR